jgi:membrane associated rhomboid family serine protease
MKLKYVTIWLVAICILFFILQLIIPSFTDSLVLNNKALSGEIWRFVTAVFLHGSFSHLLLNMFALLLFGLVLESLIGSKRFLLVFLVSGIIANIISVFFYSSSLGASGAIFGVLGVLTIIKPLMTVFVYSLPMPMFVAAIVWILIDLYGLANPSGTGNIAHLSGIVIGFIIGIYYRMKHFKKEKIKADFRSINLSEQEAREWEDRWMK